MRNGPCTFARESRCSTRDTRATSDAIAGVGGAGGGAWREERAGKSMEMHTQEARMRRSHEAFRDTDLLFDLQASGEGFRGHYCRFSSSLRPSLTHTTVTLLLLLSLTDSLLVLIGSIDSGHP